MTYMCRFCNKEIISLGHSCNKLNKETWNYHERKKQRKKKNETQNRR